MNPRQARVLALSISSLAAAGIFALAWPRIRAREEPELRFHEIEAPPPRVDPPTLAAPLSADVAEDPPLPEQWHYYLTDETASRLFGFRNDQRNEYDPWTYFRDKGNLHFVLPLLEHPTKEWIWQTNSQGCREDRDLDEVPCKVRVLVAGDSHTCGVCLNSESFANVVEARLRSARGESVEVLNAGLGAYSFHNYMGTLLRFRSFAPQVFVVTVFGGNDFMDLLAVDAALADRPMRPMSGAEHERRRSALAMSANAMGQGLAALDVFRAWSEERPAAIRIALELCAEMQRVADRHACKLIVVFLPAPFDLTWKELPRRALHAREILELSTTELNVNRQMGAAFLTGLRGQGVPTLDMRPIFEREAEPPYWRVDFHLNVRGHALVAEALEPLILAELAGR